MRVPGSLGSTASALVGVPRAGRVFRRRWASIANENRRDPRSRSNAPRRRTTRICSVRVIVVEAFPSVCWIGAQGRRARTPARLARLGRVHRAGGITPVKRGAGPAVKTGNPSLSPRGARSAVGGIRAWAGNPGSRASSSSTVLLVGGQAAVRLEAVEWLPQCACERRERRVRAVGAADAVGEQHPKHSRNS